MKRNFSQLGITPKSIKLNQIVDIARQAGIRAEELKPLGSHKAKVSLGVLTRLKQRPNGKLICITGMTPTPTGEGKTCTSIGLTQALGFLKKKTILCLREPSLAPIFGNKGGATGAGYAQVGPADDINLHFTGDIHAVEIATNLLAAVIDNHRHHGNALKIDSDEIYWRRSLDICDRQLREIIAGESKAARNERGVSAFDITSASEVMAILSLSKSIHDLKDRLGRITVALSKDKKPITAQQLKVVGAMAVLLKDALEPNLVQTLEGQPCFIHTGPFANVSHGNNSILATGMALKLADYVVTESGFGTDLGLEKLFDIVSPVANIKPSVAVIVVTLKALKAQSSRNSLQGGYANLAKHIQNVRQYGIEPVIALNRFPEDTDEEVVRSIAYIKQTGVEIAESQAVSRGSEGALGLAQAVLRVLSRKQDHFKPLYPAQNLSIMEKCHLIATKVYGADDVSYSPEAKQDLQTMKHLKCEHLPVNVAKTPLSLSDDSKLKGYPSGWTLHIKGFRVFSGAGYVIARAGNLMLMPGLSKTPMLESMDLKENGHVAGVSFKDRPV